MYSWGACGAGAPGAGPPGAIGAWIGNGDSPRRLRAQGASKSDSRATITPRCEFAQRHPRRRSHRRTTHPRRCPRHRHDPRGAEVRRHPWRRRCRLLHVVSWDLDAVPCKDRSASLTVGIECLLPCRMSPFPVLTFDVVLLPASGFPFAFEGERLVGCLLLDLGRTAGAT